MSKAIQIGLAIFFGAAIGGLVAYEASANFWWLGMIVGGGLSWVFYDLKALGAAVKNAAKAVATNYIRELKKPLQYLGPVAFVKITKAIMKTILFLLTSLIAGHGYGALIVMSIYTIKLQFSCAPLVVDYPMDYPHIINLSIIVSFVGLILLYFVFFDYLLNIHLPLPQFWKYFLLCGAIAAICLSPLWLFIPFCEQVLYPYVCAAFVFLLWLVALGFGAAAKLMFVSVILYFLAKIIWKSAKIAHRDERLLCLVYGTLGVAIAHYMTHGIMIISLSGLIGAGLGVLDYKLLPRHWFEKKTATASSC